ncbi:AlpA family transcriptional regulator [Streptomyces sp. ISL-100]|uniref:helix-turn-helix transcriptional regulator n=1 Tax=Streptomyces sp. ISL-100 TaxID=2819173 RepID=UPI001BEC33F4|nr:helix-turn-helix domain-containing protein [Streptomyces sp. ISL-100]MBT2397236.1 helix-turn-helix domain-containing protein [Streptomyces sp. ISL-100]
MSRTRALTTEEVLALPAAVDLVTAGRACGISRTTAYDLARRGEFPVPLLRLGAQYRARRADLLALLGVEQLATTPTT